MTTSSRTARGKLPQSIRILGKRWEFKLKAPKKGDFGECQFMQGRFLINPNQSLDHMRDTAFHEPLHAISEELQLNLKETQVRLLATAVLGMIRDNPGYVRFLTD